VSKSHVAFVPEGALKMIVPSSDKLNLNSNVLHPYNVNVPSEIFNLIPALGNYNLYFPPKNLSSK